MNYTVFNLAHFKSLVNLLREQYMQLSGSERVIIGARIYETARTIVLLSLPKGISEEKWRLLYERFYDVAPSGLFRDRSPDAA